MRNDDWVLVPREPTPEMRAAGERERLSNPTNMNPYHVWAAMLSAAPAAAAVVVSDDDAWECYCAFGDVFDGTNTQAALRAALEKFTHLTLPGTKPSAPADRLPVSWADFWISKGNWQLANDYATFELANQWLDANISAVAAKPSSAICRDDFGPAGEPGDTNYRNWLAVMRINPADMIAKPSSEAGEE